jgi:hypothetical protein
MIERGRNTLCPSLRVYTSNIASISTNKTYHKNSTLSKNKMEKPLF